MLGQNLSFILFGHFWALIFSYVIGVFMLLNRNSSVFWIISRILDDHRSIISRSYHFLHMLLMCPVPPHCHHCAGSLPSKPRMIFTILNLKVYWKGFALNRHEKRVVGPEDRWQNTRFVSFILPSLCYLCNLRRTNCNKSLALLLKRRICWSVRYQSGHDDCSSAAATSRFRRSLTNISPQLTGTAFISIHVRIDSPRSR